MKSQNAAYEAPMIEEVGDFADVTLGFLNWNGPDYIDHRA